jgi:hypothetical protein
MWLTTKAVLLLHEVLVVSSPKHEGAGGGVVDVEGVQEVEGVIKKQAVAGAREVEGVIDV